jgi:glucose/mannose transport system permease protein
MHRTEGEILERGRAVAPGRASTAVNLDGCGLFRAFFHVMLPLSWPGFVVAGIFQFTNVWNDFLFGLVVTSQQTWPVTVRLNNLIGTTIVDYGSLMAGPSWWRRRRYWCTCC